MSQPGGYIGRPERQRESERLVGGHGRFAVDHRPPGLCYMAVSRSPFGHARLGSIDLDRARSMSGVLGAWALADLPFLAGGMGDAPPFPDLAVVGRPVLAGDLVRYFGEPVAIVAADDPYLAVDAVEAVRPEFEPLAATADVIAAAAPGAPRIHDTIPSNVAGRLRRGFG
ncbi:MAG: xanthine dehydrogenase family protein molybdopterin-binding subunit, partial [Candidatus Dormibacteraceae bacterium]